MTKGRKLLALALMGGVAALGLIACEKPAEETKPSGLEKIKMPMPPANKPPMAPAPAKSPAAAAATTAANPPAPPAAPAAATKTP